jgi:hypothetical protein
MVDSDGVKYLGLPQRGADARGILLGQVSRPFVIHQTKQRRMSAGVEKERRADLLAVSKVGPSY